MTAVTLPDTSLSDFSGNMKMGGDTMSIFSSEYQVQSIFEEKMDQIRNTMMRHEELFKEQVQALHKLYNVQKLAMQEVRKMIWCSAQPLASSSNNKYVCCDQVNDSIDEGKHLNEAYVSAKDHIEESCVLPMNPLSAVKEFTGSSSERSFCSGIKEVKASPNSCNVQKKKIDLERPPEEYLDESDYQIESNNFDILGANTCLLEGNQNMVQDSLMRGNQSVLQIGCLSLKQGDGRPDFSTLPEPRQESHWDCSQVSERNIHRTFMKCTTGVQRLQDTFHHNILQDFPWDHLSAAGPSNTVDSHVEKRSWLIQRAASLTAQTSNYARKSDLFEPAELHLERKDPEQVNGKLLRSADLTYSTQLHLTLESNSKIALPSLDLERQLQQDLDKCFPSHGGSVPTNPTNCPQLSSNHSIQGVSNSDTNLPARDLNSCSWVLTHQTGNDNGNEDPNCSGHGSNSPLYQCENFGDKDLSPVASNNSKCSSDFEQVQTGNVEVEVMKSELKEAHQSSNNHIKTSLSSSAPGSDNKQRHAAELKCAVDFTETKKDQEKPVIVKESNKEVKSESTLEEACESIAAKILLSFAPHKSESDYKWQFCETKIEVDSSRSSRDNMGHINKQNQRTRALNYNYGIGMDEVVKRTKSVCGRRRTSRRQR